MVEIVKGTPAQGVLQGARHVLFVEGGADGLDVQVLRELLPGKLGVEGLGPSYSVRSVATALHRFHPYYWFVIDRDHWDDETVERYWSGFPDPEQENLLIWRRKELESYFLEPEWVCRSRHIRPGTEPAQLAAWLAAEVDKVLWLEAANRVLIAKRHRVKNCPGELLKTGDLQECTREQVLEKLVASPLLAALGAAVQAESGEESVRAAFDAEVECLSGGSIPLRWGEGRWRDLVCAKPLFRAMVNQWFEVKDESSNRRERVTGRLAEKAVAIDLLKHHQQTMPADFQALKEMLDKAI